MPFTTSPSETPPTRNGTVTRGRLAMISSTTNASDASSLPATIDRGRSSVSWRATIVWRSRSPEMAPAVSPGTMKQTRRSMKKSSHWKMARPAVADASRSIPPLKVSRAAAT